MIFCLVVVNIQSAFSDTYSNNPSDLQVSQSYNSLPQDTLTISTDKSNYTDGDKIVISGHVKDALSGYPVVFGILTPNGNLLSRQQVPVSSDDTYSMTINAGGNSWIQQGTYTVFAQYGPNINVHAWTTFNFKKSTPLPTGQSLPTPEEPLTAPSQIPQQNNSEPQMKIDLSGNTLLIIIGVLSQ